MAEILTPGSKMDMMVKARVALIAVGDLLPWGGGANVTDERGDAYRAIEAWFNKTAVAAGLAPDDAVCIADAYLSQAD